MDPTDDTALEAWAILLEQASMFTGRRSLLVPALVLAFTATSSLATTPDIRVQPTSLSFVPATTTPIFVEIDWMEDGTHSHQPSQLVIDGIIATFAREGYSIQIDLSNAIPHQDVLAVTNAPSSSAAVQALKATHFDNAADSRYFYSVWGHNYSYNGSFTSSSGIADLPGSTHLVTLGSFSNQVGTFSNQVGTFMHEFGHNIGQRHGGIDNNNYKPNYISVMNYFYQLNGVAASLLALNYANTSSGFSWFGYSHGQLPSLNENALDESVGIGLGRSVDWDCNGSIGAAVAKDIQASNHCDGAGSRSVLSDYDNWSAINSFVMTGALAPLSVGESSQFCATPADDQPISAAVNALRAQGLLPAEDALMVPVDSASQQGAAAHFFDVFNDGATPLTVTGMSLDTPAAWVTWEPQSFTVPPGGVQRVYVYVDFGLMPAGQTTRRILVASDDPDENPYPNGVDLTMGLAPPGAFSKTSPANAAIGQSTNPTLSWAASSGGASYDYCIDTTNDNACSLWTSTGAGTSVALTGLSANTTYYWQVRATGSGGTTYANGGSTAFWSFTTGLVGNGDFGLGLTNWLQFATPDASYLTAAVTGGVLEFYRTAPPPGETNQAVVFQETGIALASGAVIAATFDLGNSSSVRKRVSVLLHDSGFQDLSVCTFWLPAGAPLRPYGMRTHSTQAWSDATISFYAATTGSDGGFYRVDNVSIAPDALGTATETTCTDPDAPAANADTPGPTLLANGDFSAGQAPWLLFGQILWQIASGVFEFTRPAGTPSGVVFQPTGQAVTQGQVLTAAFDLGNSSSVRKRITVLLHDLDFSDLSACTFWLAPGAALATYQLRAYATEAWTDATLSVYPSTIGPEQWMRFDNAILQRTGGTAISGTDCLEPGSSLGTSPGAVATTPAVAAFPESAPLVGGRPLAWDAVAVTTGRQSIGWGAVDLRGHSAATLHLSSRLLTERSEAEVQVSRDGVSWDTIAVVPAQDDWLSMAIDLSAFAGEVVQVRLVFRAVAPAAGAPADRWSLRWIHFSGR